MKILIFGAIGCNSCLTMKTLSRNLKLEFPEIIFEYIDVDINESKVKKYNIEETPTLVFLNFKGKEITRKIGIQHRDTILEVIEDNL